MTNSSTASPDSSQGPPGTNLATIVIPLVTLPAIFIVVAAVILCRKRRKLLRERNQDPTKTEDEFNHELHARVVENRLSYDDMEISGSPRMPAGSHTVAATSLPQIQIGQADNGSVRSHQF